MPFWILRGIPSGSVKEAVPSLFQQVVRDPAPVQLGGSDLGTQRAQ